MTSIQRASTNCGDEVEFARDLVTECGLKPTTVALVQDPATQRRMDAVTRQVRPSVRPLNRPGLSSRWWPIERWVALVVGEMPPL